MYTPYVITIGNSLFIAALCALLPLATFFVIAWSF